jgi:hypothetical protein
MNIKVPPNSTATVYVPAKTAADVTVNGLSIKNGLIFLKNTANYITFFVVPGEWTFTAKKALPNKSIENGE